MTRSEWAERLPLIQAFVEGKTIEARFIDDPNDEWDEILSPAFKGKGLEYRIKPEPKVIWCNELPSLGALPHVQCFNSEDECRDKAYGANVRIAVKYVEVVE